MHPEVDDSPHNPQSQSDKAVAAATPRWSGTCSAISFTVNVNTDQAGREDGSVDDFRNAIVAAADTWNAALENSIILHYNGATDATEVGLNGVNEVVFMEQGVGQPVAMSRTWVAADQSIIETDMWINTSYDWDATGAPDANEIDLQSVVLHEFGHWLTLPHADERASIMYPSISQNMVKRSLDVKDIDRIRTLYSHMQNTQCGSTDSNAAQRSSLNEHGTGWHSQWLRRIISS